GSSSRSSWNEPHPGHVIWNAEAETLSRAARARLQLERLRETIGWAVERVAFHRERLGGVEVRRLDDLARLPFVRKTDLRDHYPVGLFAVEPGEVARLHASSGTKGKPTIVGYTAGDLEIWRGVMARVLTAAGARRGDMLHVAFGYGLFTGGLGFHEGAERVGMTVVPVSSGNTARHRLLLRDLAPAGICGTPSFVLHIAESLAAESGDPRALGLRYGLFGAEPWTEGMRASLERALGCRAYDVYGLSEIIDPGDPRGARRAGARARGALRWLRRRAPRDRQSPPARYRAPPEGDRPLRPAHDRGAADAAALRGQGGSRDRAAVGYPGSREETSMSNLAREMLAKIEAGVRIESAHEMTDDYRENLVHLLTMQADSELAGGYGYVPWITKAPTVEEKHVVAQIVKDELRHATVMYGLLADLGLDVDTHLRQHDEVRPTRLAATADVGTARI